MRQFTHCLVAALCLWNAAAAAQSQLYFRSDPGDYIGAGQERTYPASSGTFSISGSGAFITARFDAAAENWSLDLKGSASQPLGIGFFKDAARAAFTSPNKPGLDFHGSGRGCNRVAGYFRIHEFERRTDGTVIRLAVDFIQRCEAGAARLFGAYRYNSSFPIDTVAPIANAGPSRGVLEGDRVVLDGLESYRFGTGALTYRWSQVAGPAVTIAGSSDAIVSLYARQASTSGDPIRLRLMITDAAGRTAEDEVSIRLLRRIDPLSFIEFNSDPTDYIGGGMRRTWTTDDGPIAAGSSVAPSYAGIVFTGSSEWWFLDFAAAVGQRLAPGEYIGATRYPFNPPNANGLSVYGSGRGCNTLTGSFRILAIARAANEALERFAASFTQYCEGGTAALRGRVYLNQPPINPPVPMLTAPAWVLAGSVVSLDSAGSTDDGTITKFHWQQVAGPPVVIQNADLPQAFFTMAAIPAGSPAVVVQLLIFDDAGNTSIAEASIADSATPPPNAPSPGGSGGGAPHPISIAVLVLVACLVRRRDLRLQ